MLKKLLILSLIVVISGSAVYSLHSLNFFDKLGMVFQESGSGQQRGPGGQGRNGRSGRPGGHRAHAAMSLSEGLLQMGAYLAVFAFVVMLTYYAERLFVKKPLVKKKHSMPLRREFCKSE